MCVNELTPALNTTFISKDLRGTRLIAVPKGKNVKDRFLIGLGLQNENWQSATKRLNYVETMYFV